MNKEKIFHFFLLIIVVLFFCMFISSRYGYQEYRLRKSMIMTNEAIEKFEKDIQEGKEVDVEDYLYNEEVNYDNFMSRINKQFSSSISNFFSNTLKYIFKSISEYVEE